MQMLVLACGLGSRIDNLNRQLSHEIDQRKHRELQLNQAQQIARYGDWSWRSD